MPMIRWNSRALMQIGLAVATCFWLAAIFSLGRGPGTGRSKSDSSIPNSSKGSVDDTTCRGTIVTAYYNIPSKHKYIEYLDWMSNFLSLRDCMIIIISPEVEAIVRARRPRGYPTFIIKRPLSQMQVAKEMDVEGWAAQERLDPELHKGHSRELYWIWNEKTHFLFIASVINPFNSEYFVWLDIGAIRHCRWGHEYMLQHFPQEPGITLLQIQPFSWSEFVFKDGQSQANLTRVDRLGGGMIGGRLEDIELWHKAYYSVFRRFLREGRFAGKDQSVMAATCLETDMCLLVSQPVDSFIRGPNWFYLQDYFHGSLNKEPARLNASQYRSPSS